MLFIYYSYFIFFLDLYSFIFIVIFQELGGRKRLTKTTTCDTMDHFAHGYVATYLLATRSCYVDINSFTTTTNPLNL